MKKSKRIKALEKRVKALEAVVFPTPEGSPPPRSTANDQSIRGAGTLG